MKEINPNVLVAILLSAFLLSIVVISSIANFSKTEVVEASNLIDTSKVIAPDIDTTLSSFMIEYANSSFIVEYEKYHAAKAFVEYYEKKMIHIDSTWKF